MALAAAERRRDRHPLGPTEVATAGCVALVATGELSAAQMLAERSHQAAVETVRRLGWDAAPAVGACAAAQGIVAKAQGRAVMAPVLTAWVERARAWVTAAEGDLPGIAGQALRAGTLARGTQQPTIEALATYDAARFGDTSTAHEHGTR
jgi:hypothetical protein